MMNMQLLNRSGLAAIAAATALISTPALAQDVTPVTPDPAPIVADEALPSAPTTTPEAASDTLAPVAPATTIVPTTRTARPTRVTTAPAARPSATAAPRRAAPVAVAPEAPPTADAGLPPVDPAMVAPLPEPVAATPTAPASDSLIDDDLVPIAGAAGLGILALAGVGFAMRRRRRNDDEAMVEETMAETVPTRPVPLTSARPIAATAPFGASAFSWNSTPGDSAKPVDRIEAAKRGPTPDNPSLSLKKRLKRAAFFDQRDRQIAAGMGTPVSAIAGLPDGMTSDTPTHSASPRRLGQGQSNSVGKIVQPA